MSIDDEIIALIFLINTAPTDHTRNAAPKEMR